MTATIAKQLDEEFTSRQRAKLTKHNVIKMGAATLFYLIAMGFFIIFEV